MKIKFIILTAILISLVLIFNSFSNNDSQKSFEPLELELGDEFTFVKLDMAKYVLNYSIFDITGDKVNDMVIAVGAKSEEEGLYKNVDLIIYDTASKTFIISGIKKCETKLTKIENRDMNCDGIDDAILITDNLNSTKNVRILTICDGKSKEIFGINDNKGVVVQGMFLDGFKADINIKNLKLKNSYDLTSNKTLYIENGFYSDNGKLTTTKNQITSSHFTDIEFVELSNCYGIKSKQNVKGFDNLDILDEIEVLWKFDNGKWIICEAKSVKLGNLLY